jgi:hypothetical protein
VLLVSQRAKARVDTSLEDLTQSITVSRGTRHKDTVCYTDVEAIIGVITRIARWRTCVETESTPPLHAVRRLNQGIIFGNLPVVIRPGMLRYAMHLCTLLFMRS